MAILKIIQLSIATLLLILAVSKAQDYLSYDDDISDSRGRLPLAPIRTHHKYQNGVEEPKENVRLRRQGDSGGAPRYRRQGGGGGHEGVTGPVHTFVKTDEHAHFKWGVRHHVGHEYAGRR